jgi:SAM-dependent methyltransferase
MSEIEKYRHLCVQYCVGNGIDVGSGGTPIVPNAIQVELPPEQYSVYRSGDVHRSPIQWHGDCWHLPFKDNVLDFVASSHLIEDFPRDDWPTLFSEWTRVLKPGGYMVLIVPERTRWRAAIARGQTPNCSHYGPEPLVGDISQRASQVTGLTIISEALTNLSPEDYSILAILQKRK